MTHTEDGWVIGDWEVVDEEGLVIAGWAGEGGSGPVFRAIETKLFHWTGQAVLNLLPGLAVRPEDEAAWRQALTVRAESMAGGPA